MRALLFLFLLSAIVGCSSPEPPRSSYFLVFFQPGSADLLPEGRAALARASRDAARGSPREVVIHSYHHTDGAEQELNEQRLDEVAKALTTSGIPAELLRRVPTEVDAATYAQFGNSVYVQVLRGEAPKPPEPEEP